MSLASTYAASIATAKAGAPASFTGPGGVLSASVDENGNCLLTINNTQMFSAPGAAMLSFASWVTTTFT